MMRGPTFVLAFTAVHTCLNTTSTQYVGSVSPTDGELDVRSYDDRLNTATTTLKDDTCTTVQ